MIELTFKEPETFQTPDGTIWTINPLPTREMKRVNKFIELNTDLQRRQQSGDSEAANELIYGSDIYEGLTLTELCEELIDKSITNESGEPFPTKYRTIFKMIELCGLIVTSTLNLPDNLTPTKSEGKDGEDNPLEQVRKSSDKSELAVTSSSKKQDGKEKKS